MKHKGELGKNVEWEAKKINKLLQEHNGGCLAAHNAI